MILEPQGPYVWFRVPRFIAFRSGLRGRGCKGSGLQKKLVLGFIGFRA